MEKWDLYDENRQKLGKTIKKGQNHDGAYTLRVHFCLFNSSGQMLVQQRASSKKHWPNVWDITLSGSAQVGETSKEAINREVKEEFGLDIDFSTERACFTFNYANCFDDFYIIEKDIEIKDIKFMDGEVQSVAWVTKEEILQKIRDKNFIQYYPSLIEAIFEIREEKGIYLPMTNKY